MGISEEHREGLRMARLKGLRKKATIVAVVVVIVAVAGLIWSMIGPEYRRYMGIANTDIVKCIRYMQSRNAYIRISIGEDRYEGILLNSKGEAINEKSDGDIELFSGGYVVNVGNHIYRAKGVTKIDEAKMVASIRDDSISTNISLEDDSSTVYEISIPEESIKKVFKGYSDGVMGSISRIKESQGLHGVASVEYMFRLSGDHDIAIACAVKVDSSRFIMWSMSEYIENKSWVMNPSVMDIEGKGQDDVISSVNKEIDCILNKVGAS